MKVVGMGWFSDVPDELKIGRERFLLAGQALEIAEQRVHGPLGWGAQGERPDEDWVAQGLFWITRLQLDQVISLLSSHFDLDARRLSGHEVTRRLTMLTKSVPGGELAAEDFAYELEIIGEAVDLWRSLEPDAVEPVRHGFAVDGSISITTGPQLPELTALGIKASDGHELRTSPAQSFSAAMAATMEVATLAVLYEHWLREGYEREEPDLPDDDDPKRCPASGTDSGRMIEIPGMDDWKIRCPECATTWAGGSTLLEEHDRR